MGKEKFEFIQGVIYSAGLIKQYNLSAEQLLKEAGITEDVIKEYADDHDLENLGMTR